MSHLCIFLTKLYKNSKFWHLNFKSLQKKNLKSFFFHPSSSQKKSLIKILIYHSNDRTFNMRTRTNTLVYILD